MEISGRRPMFQWELKGLRRFSWLKVQYIASLASSYLSHTYFVFHDFSNLLCICFSASTDVPVSLTLSGSSFNCNFACFAFPQKNESKLPCFFLFSINKRANEICINKYGGQFKHVYCQMQQRRSLAYVFTRPANHNACYRNN